ncbi:MAG: iron ABC transporter permease [Flavobacteriales bacterium]|nr:iron ABC transporter permease [Flavobacteriales bacterium]
MTGSVRTWWHRNSALWPVALLALLFALPLAVVLTAPLHTPSTQWDHIAQVFLPGHLASTLALLAAVLLPALVLAVPSAWLIARFDFPLRGFLRWALVLPLALPTYISAYTYAGLLGPTGSISVWLATHWNIRPDIMHLPGLGWVLAFVLFPYVYLPTRVAFATGMSHVLDAARTLGASPVRRFMRIALPLARPAIVGGAVLVAMETLNDYGAVKYFGVRTLTTAIFRSWGGLYDPGGALRLSLVIIGLVALLLYMERRSRRGLTTTAQVRGSRERLRGGRAWMATGWCLLVFMLGVALPLGKILGDAWTTLPEADHTRLWAAARNTLLLAVLSASVVLLVALGFVFRQRVTRRTGALVRAAALGYAMPGAVIAIGVMALAAALDNWSGARFSLIGGIWLMVYALAVRFLSVGWRPLQAGIRQQSASLDEAARMLGASPWRTFTRVNLPLLRPTLLAAATLVAIDVVKELPLTLILRPFRLETLGTLTYELAGIEQLREAALPAALIVLCGLLPVLLLEWLGERHG